MADKESKNENVHRIGAHRVTWRKAPADVAETWATDETVLELHCVDCGGSHYDTDRAALVRSWQELAWFDAFQALTVDVGQIAGGEQPSG